MYFVLRSLCVDKLKLPMNFSYNCFMPFLFASFVKTVSLFVCSLCSSASSSMKRMVKISLINCLIGRFLAPIINKVNFMCFLNYCGCVKSFSIVHFEWKFITWSRSITWFPESSPYFWNFPLFFILYVCVHIIYVYNENFVSSVYSKIRNFTATFSSNKYNINCGNS